MTHRELLLYWSTVGFEILLCVFVSLRNIRRQLPYFALNSFVLLIGTLGLKIFYTHFGFRSLASYYAVWAIAGTFVIARSLAIIELCRYELRGYQGIWTLTWRVLLVLGVCFLAHAAYNAWGQVGGVAIYGLTIERDVAFTAIVILLALLVIRNYYGLTLEPLHMWIAIGMFNISIIDAANNTVLRNIFASHLVWFFSRYASSWSALRPQIEGATDLWNMIRTSGILLSMTIWCYALCKPLPAPTKAPVLLPAEVYGELSPAVNLRLRAFNSRLLEMLKS